MYVQCTSHDRLRIYNKLFILMLFLFYLLFLPNHLNDCDQLQQVLYEKSLKPSNDYGRTFFQSLVSCSTAPTYKTNTLESDSSKKKKKVPVVFSVFSPLGNYLK
jgi:hypothetical protein